MQREIFVGMLRNRAEEQYRIFNQKFVLTNKNPMLGVKVPEMREIAKEVVAGEWRAFLKGYGFYGDGTARCVEVFFEEIMIIGMVINLANMPPEERLGLVTEFVPLIDNWAVCDVFCGGTKWVGEPGRGAKASNRVSQEVMWDFLRPYLQGKQEGNREFQIRFAVVMLMCRFLNETYLPMVFEVLKGVPFGDYYVDMAVAWCLATARGKFDLETQEFVAAANLPAGVIKKYEQKVRDSFRLKKRLSSQ